MCVPQEQNFQIRFLKLTSDKLINHMSYKYVKRVNCLILIINTKHQQIH